MNELKVASVQLPTLDIGATKLEVYIKQASINGVDLVLLPEYVLNNFFKELYNITPSMLQQQSKKHIEVLKHLSTKYDLYITAPIINVINGDFVKQIVLIKNNIIETYNQQILISYEHWNEKEFFSNIEKPFDGIIKFNIGNFNIAMFSGFELHFYNFWQEVIKNEIDLVLLPTSATFDSHNRWKEIMKTQALLSGCYILRANRLGQYKDESFKWNFYGNSMLVSPNGEIVSSLNNEEGILIEHIKKDDVLQYRKLWKFSDEYNHI